jgi:hypothetical protein
MKRVKKMMRRGGGEGGGGVEDKMDLKEAEDLMQNKSSSMNGEEAEGKNTMYICFLAPFKSGSKNHR